MDPRAQRMIDDPAGYFAEARKEARAMVERDMARERELARRQRREAMSSSAKALVAFVLAFATSLVAQLQDKTEFSDLTGLQWLVVVLSAVITGAAVYAVPNSPPSS